MCGPGTTLCLANLALRTSIARGLNTASYKTYPGYLVGTYRGIPQGAIPAPPGVPYPNTPRVPIQGVLQTSTQGISSTLVYTLAGTPYPVNSTRRHHATVTFTQITPSSITLSSWTTRVPYVGTACLIALASYDSTG